MNTSGAILSDCGRYRYYLQRTWDGALPRLCFVMLNPSTADATVDDATIRVCRGRAAKMGMGGLDVVNLFALRSTDPEALYRAEAHSPISEPGAEEKNDAVIEKVVKRASGVICAWGKHGALLHRGKIVLARFKEWGIKPCALKLNSDGSPAHPLRIGYDKQPFPFGG